MSGFPQSGASGKGLPLGLTGATSATRYVGGTASAAPVSGPFVVGDFDIAQDGHIWVCTVAGSPGTWVDAGSSGGPPSGAAGGDLTGSTYPNPVVAANAITLAKLATIADQLILGNNTGGAAAPLGLTAAQVRTILALAAIATSGSAADLSAGTLPAGRFPALTGDVTTAAGALAATIAAAAVTYAKMQNVSASSRVLGRISAGAGSPEELTAANLNTILNRYPDPAAAGPTGTNGVTFDRFTVSASSAQNPLASGTLYLCPVKLAAGTTISNVNFRTGSTAATTPTHSLTGLFDTSLNQLATSADQGSLALGANTNFVVPQSVPYAVPTSGYYLLGLMIVAAVVPTLTGASAPLIGLVNVAPVLLGSSSTGQTTTLPNPAGAITGVAIIPYMWTT